MEWVNDLLDSPPEQMSSKLLSLKHYLTRIDETEALLSQQEKMILSLSEKIQTYDIEKSEM